MSGNAHSGVAHRGRSGLVLVGVLAALVAMALLGHAAVLLARFEAAASRASLATTRARIAAESGLVRAGASVLPRAADSLAPGATLAWADGTLGPARWNVDLRRVDAETWLAEALGRDGPEGRGAGVGVARAGVLWRLDPVARIDRAVGVVEVAAGAPASGGVDTGDWAVRPSGVAASTCPAPGSSPVGVARTVRDAHGPPGLGLVDRSMLDAALLPLPADEASPAPERFAGGCSAGAWNWGDPGAEPDAPCGDRFVAASAAGDFTMRGGVGQGLLAVSGDLVLTDGALFSGVVLVGGLLRVHAGATFRGYARAREGLEASGTVVGSACAGVRALAAASGLAALLPVPGWHRIGSMRAAR